MKTKLLGVIAITLILFTSGCMGNDYILDKEESIYEHPETGQRLRNDILCQPLEDSDVYKVYEDNLDQMTVKLEELPSCTSFSITSNESASLWELMFVKPLAWLIINIGQLVGNLGIAVMIVGVFIRFILLPVQIKNSRQSMNMRKAMPEIKKLDTKYSNRTDAQAQMAKSQEIAMIYKKYKISPAIGCLLAFVQLPVFFAFLDAVYRTPAIYEETLFGWSLGVTPQAAITAGNYSYLILVGLMIISTFFSFRYSMSQAPAMDNEAAQRTKTMMNVMLVVVIISSFSFPVAQHLYWIVTYAFIAVQTYFIKWYLGDNEPKEKVKKESIKDKLLKKEGKKYGKNN